MAKEDGGGFGTSAKALCPAMWEQWSSAEKVQIREWGAWRPNSVSSSGPKPCSSRLPAGYPVPQRGDCPVRRAWARLKWKRAQRAVCLRSRLLFNRNKPSTAASCSPELRSLRACMRLCTDERRRRRFRLRSLDSSVLRRHPWKRDCSCSC